MREKREHEYGLLGPDGKMAEPNEDGYLYLLDGTYTHMRRELPDGGWHPTPLAPWWRRIVYKARRLATKI